MPQGPGSMHATLRTYQITLIKRITNIAMLVGVAYCEPTLVGVAYYEPRLEGVA